MSTKVCIGCGTEKPIEEFPYKSFIRRTRQTKCKVCTAENSSRWYAENKDHHKENVKVNRQKSKQRAREYVYQYLLTHPCESCGKTDPEVLEFHHVHGKDREIARMVASAFSVEAIAAEIARCKVLCANCHRKLTAKEKGWFKWRT
jgi:hypothetical protein